MEKATCAVQISNTFRFRHHHLTQPEVTPMDLIVHGVNKLICALKDAPQIACDNQLFTINVLHQAVQRWTTSNTYPRAQPPRATTLYPHNQRRSILRPMRRTREERPPRHFQGWSFQSHRTYQYRPHPPQVQKNPLHGARVLTYHPCTGHLQGCTKQLTQRPLPVTHVQKP